MATRRAAGAANNGGIERIAALTPNCRFHPKRWKPSLRAQGGTCVSAGMESYEVGSAQFDHRGWEGVDGSQTFLTADLQTAREVPAANHRAHPPQSASREVGRRFDASREVPRKSAAVLPSG